MQVLRRLLLALVALSATVAGTARVASAQKLGTIELGAFAHWTKVNDDPLLGSSTKGGGLRGGLYLFRYFSVETEYGIGTIGDPGKSLRYPNGKWYPERIMGVAHIPIGERAKLLLGIGHVDTWKGDITLNTYEEGLTGLVGVGICMGDAWYLRPELVYDKTPVKDFHQGFEVGPNVLPGTAAKSTRYQFRLGISRFIGRGSNTCRRGETEKKAPPPPPPPAPVVVAPPPPPPAPTASLSVSPASIRTGQSSTISWSSSNATTCSAPWMSGTANRGTQSVNPTTSTSYNVTCTGPGGSANASTSLTVTQPPPPPPPPAPPAPPRELYQLLGVNFDFDKSTIKPVGKAKLDSAVTVLSQFPDMRVEIQGHTDAVGTDAYNQGLSERRAKAVLDYLVSKGVSASRLVTKGYGESKPVATNDTKEGRALNRRVMLIELR